eukprot:superscaffoldBa00000051_g880
MNPARRCSALLSQLCVSSLGGPTTRRPFSPGAVSAPAGPRRSDTGVRGGRGGVNGTCPQLKPSGASTPGAAPGYETLSIVEGQGFHVMVNTVYPQYTLPSRAHFTTLIERRYDQTLERLKAKPKSLTTDG